MTKQNNQRTCIVSRNTAPSTEMIRFVLDPDGNVIPDIKGNLPGRGMWVSGTREMVAKAVKTNMFSKSAKAQVKANDNIIELCESLLKKKLIESISLGRRSGDVVNGFEKVKELLKTEDCQMVFMTSTDSDSSQKLLGMCKMLELPFYTVLDANELSQVLSGENVNYAGMKKCGISSVINENANRLKLFVDGDMNERRQ